MRMDEETTNVMIGSETDNKNIELLKLLAQLRDHIDIHRIIGLNVEALRKSEISHAFLGYLQKTAQESLALYFCKIFEPSKAYNLNSIPESLILFRRPPSPVITYQSLLVSDGSTETRPIPLN